jgi:hypothetical protein
MSELKVLPRSCAVSRPAIRGYFELKVLPRSCAVSRPAIRGYFELKVLPRSCAPRRSQQTSPKVRAAAARAAAGSVAHPSVANRLDLSLSRVAIDVDDDLGVPAGTV